MSTGNGNTMSTAKENIFARWSRRKQAVRDSEGAPADDAGPAGAEAGEGTDQPAAPSEPRPAENDEAAPLAEAPEAADEPAVLEELPSLDDLTAESDLSAFLRDGVPKALKAAAMRRMWSLDPAIRDYVGPSEYAWDFNQPGSMAGFGPLDPKSTAVDDFLATMSKRVQTTLDDVIKGDGTAGETAQPRAAPEDGEDGEAPDEAVAEDDPPDDPPETAPVPAELPPAPVAPVIAAAPAEIIEPAEPRDIMRPRHGGAMPR